MDLAIDTTKLELLSDMDIEYILSILYIEVAKREGGLDKNGSKIQVSTMLETVKAKVYGDRTLEKVPLS